MVHRSEWLRDAFVRELAERLRLSGRVHRVEWRRPRHVGGPRLPARGQRVDRVDWTSAVDPPGGDALYIFDDLKEVLEDGPAARALLDELERKVSDRSHVLLWSRVVPDYRYSDHFDPADRWFDRGHWDDVDRRDRWSSLAREFRPCVLGWCASAEAEERFRGLAGAPDVTAVNKAMQDEFKANPDLLHVARSVSTDVLGNVARGALSAREARAVAVAQFGKSAASCFSLIWAESTRDERLQLYALARGGAVDSRRTAALSSLVNRGIVRENPETGVVELRSAAFREFIEHDVDHGELDAWRKEGGGGVWRFLWPPLAIGGVLGLAFLALANPEMRATLLATLLGLLPAALPLLGGRRAGSFGVEGTSGA